MLQDAATSLGHDTIMLDAKITQLSTEARKQMLTLARWFWKDVSVTLEDCTLHHV